MRAVPFIALCDLVLVAVSALAQDGIEHDGLLAHRRSMLGVFESSSALAYEFGGLPAPFLLDEPTTIAEVAERLSLSVEDLTLLNPLLAAVKSDKIQPGFAINVPGKAALPPLPATLTLHTGDEARSFALAYSISLEELAKANPKVDFDNFDKPHTVHVPAPANFELVECPKDAVCVLPSESLTTLSGRLQCDVEDILAANPHILKQGGHLFVNQILRTPGSNPAVPAGSISVQAGDNVYDLLLKTAGVPVSPAYLARLAVANDAATIEDLVAISSSEVEIDLVDPASAEMQLPASDEQPSQARRKLMSAPMFGHGSAFPFRATGRQLLQEYSPAPARRLSEASALGAPLLTRLHQKSGSADTTVTRRNLAESDIARSVAEGDADALLKALQTDVNMSGPMRRLHGMEAEDSESGMLDALISRVSSVPKRRSSVGLLNSEPRQGMS